MATTTRTLMPLFRTPDRAGKDNVKTFFASFFQK
jgi:hypothetical protein